MIYCESCWSGKRLAFLNEKLNMCKNNDIIINIFNLTIDLFYLTIYTDH